MSRKDLINSSNTSICSHLLSSSLLFQHSLLHSYYHSNPCSYSSFHKSSQASQTFSLIHGYTYHSYTYNKLDEYNSLVCLADDLETELKGGLK